MLNDNTAYMHIIVTFVALSFIGVTFTCHFSWMRPGQDFYIALIQSTSIAFRKHNGLHTQTKPNPRYFRPYRNPGQYASGGK